MSEDIQDIVDAIEEYGNNVIQTITYGKGEYDPKTREYCKHTMSVKRKAIIKDIDITTRNELKLTLSSRLLLLDNTQEVTTFDTFTFNGLDYKVANINYITLHDEVYLYKVIVDESTRKAV